MKRLALTVAPSACEAPTSFLSRLAARNLSPDIFAFSKDVGLNIGAIICGDEQEIHSLCSLAGCSPLSFKRTTVIKTSTTRYRIGNEDLYSEIISRSTIRYCPSCLREGLQRASNVWEIVQPLHWQFLPIRCCVQHGARLLNPSFPVSGRAAYDFTAFVRDHRTELLSFEADSDGMADRLDHYLTDRAYGRHVPNWCDRLAIPPLVKACEAFGILKQYGPKVRRFDLSAEQRRDAMEVGFKALEGGSEGIIATLDQFRTPQQTPGGRQPHPQLGTVQSLLGSDRKNRPDLDPVRDVVRQHLLDNYPFKAGSMVMGVVLDEVRIHSLSAATKELGTRLATVKRLLLLRGLAHRDKWNEFYLDTLITADVLESLRRDLDDFIGKVEAAQLLGCSDVMFRWLLAEGLPGGWVKGLKRGKLFRRSDLTRLLERVGSLCRTIKDPRLHVSMHKAAIILGKSSPAVLGLVLDQVLPVAIRAGEPLRLDALLVDKRDLAALQRARRSRDPSCPSTSQT